MNCDGGKPAGQLLSRRDFLKLAGMMGAGALLASCTPPLPDFSDQETDTLRRLLILYTNDEHGWLEASADAGGVAGLARLWKRQEGYSPEGAYLVLSGGDMFTGPALSTWFEGESTIDLMNTLDYAAAAVGNHDFDDGVDVLRQRAAQAHFPLLSANIRRKDTGTVPDFAQPYVIKEVNGIRIGLLGLTTLETPVDTRPAHVSDFDFLPYEQALRETVPLARAEGAALLVLVGHICTVEMRALVPLALELGIPLICGGHCHEETVDTIEGVTIVQSGSFWRNYIRVALLFDTVSSRVVSLEASLQRNEAGRGDEVVAGQVAAWRAMADPLLWEVIGYTAEKIGWNSVRMANLLTRPWLAAYPQAQIALFSPRYVQSMPPGEIARASILSMMPTDNELVDMQLTGAQLIETIEARQPLLGGLSMVEGNFVLADGTPLTQDARYHILIPSALYEGGNYYEVQQFDAGARYTGLDWRSPVEEWVASLHTTRQSPLETYLD